MTQEQLDKATGEITRILTPFHKHAGERAANIVMALQGCDSDIECLYAINEMVHDGHLPASTPRFEIMAAWLQVAEIVFAPCLR